MSRRDEVIGHICATRGFVHKYVFAYGEAADCICGYKGEDPSGYQDDAGVQRYIEDAVVAAVARDEGMSEEEARERFERFPGSEYTKDES